jgi:DNA-binding response OmpR family regulator
LENSKLILVCDDEAHIRRVIELKLKSRGYKVITAVNGEEGLNLIRTEEPDAVISDINMPKLDGKSLCEMTNPLKSERPFLTLIITARISPDEEKWVDQMQDTQFMEKPFSPSKLLVAIDTYFGIKR